MRPGDGASEGRREREQQQEQYLIATGLLACTIPALAQSKVSIYGVVDAYGQYLDGRAKVGRVQSGGLNSSRLGFRGVEDLSGGLRAFFTLESGFNLDDDTIGQGGPARVSNSIRYATPEFSGFKASALYGAVPAGLTAVGSNGLNEFVLGVRHSF